MITVQNSLDNDYNFWKKKELNTSKPLDNNDNLFQKKELGKKINTNYIKSPNRKSYDQINFGNKINVNNHLNNHFHK